MGTGLGEVLWRRYEYARNLGFAAEALYEIQKLRLQWSPPKTPFVWLSSKYASSPVRCRPNTSDMLVFRQIFAQREYRCLDHVQDAELVIDCGANVGYSSVYFLSRFPRADVIAVEPDRDNFAVLEANVAPFGGRCKVLRTGIWSHSTDLVISKKPFGDGREWARTVCPPAPGETPTMTAIDIGTLLAQSGHARISILKIDIEGSESQVFATNYEAWLDKVDNLVIELHGDEARAIFRSAIASQGFATSECDELFVCRRN